MNTINLKARAKINLSLDVLKRRSDDYHDVEMIMQSVEVFDEICLKKSNNSIKILTNSSSIPTDQKNIAFKAAKIVMDKYDIKSGIEIFIQKNIPVCAGLAGGSTDAASVIRGINELFELGLSDDDMMEIGVGVGADVPFCISGGTMIARGIGEKLLALSPFSGVDILIVKPKIDVSTADVYNNLKLDDLRVRPDINLIVNAIERRDLKEVAVSMVNVLEQVTEVKHPIITDIKTKMIEAGALGSMMSGSGPSVFGVFDCEEKSKRAAEIFKENGFMDVFSVKTV